VLWFWDHATDSRGADVAGESLAVGGQREPPVWSGAQQGPWGGRVATRLFSDDQLERLRSFPDIGRDELIRFFALTSPCSVRCQLALVGSKPYRRSRTAATTLATRASKASSSSASAALATNARRSHRTPARQIRSMARVAVMSARGSPDTSVPAPRSGGQPGREEQGPDIPEWHHAAGHPAFIGVGLQRGSGGQRRPSAARDSVRKLTVAKSADMAPPH